MHNKHRRGSAGYTGLIRSGMMMMGLMLVSGIVAQTAAEPAVLQQDSVITTANAAQLAEVERWEGYAGGVSGLAFSPDGQQLVAVGHLPTDGQSLHLWSLAERPATAMDNFLAEYPVDEAVLDVRYSPDGTRLMVVGKAARVWDAVTGDWIGEVQQWRAARSLFVTHSLAGGSNDTLLIASADTLGMWHIPAAVPVDNEMLTLPDDYVFVQGGALMAALQLPAPVIDMVYDAVHGMGFVLTTEGIVYQYSYPEGRPQLTPMTPGMADSTGLRRDNGLALDADRQQMAYVEAEGEVVVYDYAAEVALTTLMLDAPINCLAYNADGSLLLLGDLSESGSIHVVRTADWETLVTVATGDPLTHCAFSGDGRWVATGGRDGTVRLWGVG
jgi:WD40 repeat protein